MAEPVHGHGRDRELLRDGRAGESPSRSQGRILQVQRPAKAQPDLNIQAPCCGGSDLAGHTGQQG